ncbi:MAG: hypothetical protein QN163_10535 [Armatimonadota bacterium]|nr:hypothetical protein [Armatimonadota bacterium]MDR5698188.1 hypothetical protein [Armatimonadota bacterium]
MSRHGIQVLNEDGAPRLPLLEGDGRFVALVWPGVGARHRSLHLISLLPGTRTVRLLHAESEAVYCAIRGCGFVLDEQTGQEQPIAEGAMFHVTEGTPYRIRAGQRGLVCVGGPCPPDPSLYEASGVVGEPPGGIPPPVAR